MSWELAKKAMNEPGVALIHNKDNRLIFYYNQRKWVTTKGDLVMPDFNEPGWQIYEEPKPEPKCPICNWDGEEDIYRSLNEEIMKMREWHKRKKVTLWVPVFIDDSHGHFHSDKFKSDKIKSWIKLEGVEE